MEQKPSEKLQQFIDELFVFIKHNLSLGYITEDMTIGDFRDVFLTNLDENYIPMLEKIERSTKNNMDLKDV